MLITKIGKNMTTIYIAVVADHVRKENFIKLFPSKAKMKDTQLEIIKYTSVKVRNLV